jgi:hypothetical protein
MRKEFPYKLKEKAQWRTSATVASFIQNQKIL